MYYSTSTVAARFRFFHTPRAPACGKRDEEGLNSLTNAPDEETVFLHVPLRNSTTAKYSFHNGRPVLNATKSRGRRQSRPRNGRRNSRRANGSSAQSRELPPTPAMVSANCGLIESPAHCRPPRCNGILNGLHPLATSPNIPCPPFSENLKIWVLSSNVRFYSPTLAMRSSKTLFSRKRSNLRRKHIKLSARYGAAGTGRERCRTFG